MGKKSFISLFILFFLISIVFVFASSDDDGGGGGDDDEHHSIIPATPLANCTAKLGVDARLLPFDTSSLKCHTSWASEDFILMHGKGGNGVWSFILSAPAANKGYITIGFSPNGKMVGSNAIAGWLSDTGKGMAKQYYLAGESSKACKPDTGNLQLAPSKTMVISQSSRLYLTFQLLNTTQPLSQLIYAKGSTPDSESYLPFHTSKVSTKIDYETGGGEEEEEEDGRLLMSHGILNLIGWGVLIPVGILFARYAKSWDPMWFYTHLAIQALGFCLGLAGFIIGFKLEDADESRLHKHKYIGISVLILGSLQMLAMLARPTKGTKVRKIWNVYHGGVGVVGMVLAILNIFYGLYLTDEDKSWKIGFGIFISVWGLVYLVLDRIKSN